MTFSFRTPHVELVSNFEDGCHALTHLRYEPSCDSFGVTSSMRPVLRQRDAIPMFDDLEAFLTAQLNRISGKSELAKVIRFAPGGT
ncbi:MAG: hypothetical protein AAGD43_00355 [Pseudomonadota bacterium]